MKLYCKYCGSDELRWDAFAEQDENGEMSLLAVFDYCECEHCGETTPVPLDEVEDNEEE